MGREEHRTDRQEQRYEERLLADLKRVEGGGGVHSAVRINYWFFGLSFIVGGVVLLYLLVNGWPVSEGETQFFILMLIAAWASMLLAVLWGERIWTKE